MLSHGPQAQAFARFQLGLFAKEPTFLQASLERASGLHGGTERQTSDLFLDNLGNGQNALSRVLFRKRELAEFCGKLGEFCKKLDEFALAHKY